MQIEFSGKDWWCKVLFSLKEDSFNNDQDELNVLKHPEQISCLISDLRNWSQSAIFMAAIGALIHQIYMYSALVHDDLLKFLKFLIN